MPTIVILVITWSAFGFGAVYPWVWVPLAIVCATLGVWGLINSTDVGPRTVSWPLAWAGGLTALSIAFQLVPLPLSVLGFLSPETITFLTESDVSFAIDPVGWRPISISPGQTLSTLVLYVSFFVFMLGLARTLSKADAWRVTRALAWVGLLMALVGIVQRPLFTGEIYGFWLPQQPGMVFGPFVNRNHFAGWMLMTVGVVMGAVAADLAEATRHVTRTLRDKLLWLSSRQASWILFALFSLAVMGTSLVFASSRSGMASFVSATLIFVWFIATNQRGGRRRTSGALFVIGALLAGIGWAGINVAIDRFKQTTWVDANERLGVWRDSASIIQSFPLFGSGLNTFGTAMLKYQHHAGSTHHFSTAHNDYLQLVSDGGVVTSLLAFTTMGMFARTIRLRYDEARHDSSDRLLRVGAIIGLVAIALQELVEFSLQMPANAALFAVLGALAIRTAKPGRAPNVSLRVRTDATNPPSFAAQR